MRAAVDKGAAAGGSEVRSFTVPSRYHRRYVRSGNRQRKRPFRGLAMADSPEIHGVRALHRTGADAGAAAEEERSEWWRWVYSGGCLDPVINRLDPYSSRGRG